MNVALAMMLPTILAANPVPAPGCAACGPTGPSAMTMPVGPPYPPPDAPGQLPCPPLPPAPLLAGKVLAPNGVRVTALPGTPAARSYDAPATFGFRPGYIYTLEISNLPNRPGEVLYPILEVRGTLVPRPGMKYMDYPAPILITRLDIERALSGNMVTKVIYLEDPTKAVPVETKADMPIEFTDLTQDEAFKSADQNGRIVAILRFGDRRPEPQDLARTAIPGTVLMPGEGALTAPAVPPLFQSCGVPLFLYDPILGPKPSTVECFTDGGDLGPRIGIGPDGKLGGLNPTDVAAEYTVGNKRRTATSNRVCVCSPRYALRRVELSIGALQSNSGPDAIAQVEGRVVVSARTPPMAVIHREKPIILATKLRPGITLSTLGIAEFVGLSKPQLVAANAGVKVIGTYVEPEEITSIPNELLVTKSVEPAGPVMPGDVVTFTLRYQNATRQAVTDLLLSDSLSGRLQYVPGSARSDRPTNVTTADNEAGSVIVRFEIPGPIPAGQGGVVRFQAKVR